MSPGERPGPREGHTWLRVGGRYLAPLLVRRFPPELPFGFVGQIVPTGAPIELALVLERLPPAEALRLAESARSVAEAELVAGNGGSERSTLEVEHAETRALGQAVARRAQGLWRVGLCLIADGPSRARAERERLRLAERLGALGFVTRVPRHEAAPALHLGSADGPERRPAGQVHTLTTDGVAALFPFVDESVLEPGGVLVGLALADASPVFLERWSHASYSWGLFGTTGSGKSFAAALIALRTRWVRPDLELVVLDPLGEYSGWVRALGGEVVRLADGDAGTLNPLDPATTGDDRREKAGRVTAMLRALFPSLTDEEGVLLDTTVSQLYERPGLPTMALLADELAGAGPRSQRLRHLLEVFRTGSLRFVDGPTTLDPRARTVGFDFSGIPEDQLAFHLAYVLDWTYGRLRTRAGPKLVLVDEAHLLARHDSTTEFLDRLVRHMRHFDAGLLLLTQGPDDFLVRPSGRALLRNLYATGFLRLNEVSDAARAFFGLGAAEAEWLPKARLPRENGYSESLWRIGEWHLPLALVASTPEYEFLTSVFRAGAQGPDGPGTSSRSGGL